MVWGTVSGPEIQTSSLLSFHIFSRDQSPLSLYLRLLFTSFHYKSDNIEYNYRAKMDILLECTLTTFLQILRGLEGGGHHRTLSDEDNHEARCIRQEEDRRRVGAPPRRILLPYSRAGLKIRCHSNPGFNPIPGTLFCLLTKELSRELKIAPELRKAFVYVPMEPNKVPGWNPTWIAKKAFCKVSFPRDLSFLDVISQCQHCLLLCGLDDFRNQNHRGHKKKEYWL